MTLEICPAHELIFQGPFNINSSVTLNLANRGDAYLAFQFKTNASPNLRSTVKRGFLEPYAEENVQIILLPEQADHPYNESSQYRMTVHWTVISDISMNDIDNFWKSNASNNQDIHHIHLKCVLTNENSADSFAPGNNTKQISQATQTSPMIPKRSARLFSGWTHSFTHIRPHRSQRLTSAESPTSIESPSLQKKSRFLSRFKKTKPLSITIGHGTISVEQGDITKQKIDVIIGTLIGNTIDRKILKEAGSEANDTFASEYERNPHSLIIPTPPGHLNCHRIFFIKWDPYANGIRLYQAVADFVWNIVQNVIAHDFQSVAIPIGGEQESTDTLKIIIEAMIKSIQKQIIIRKLSIFVKIVVESDEQFIYSSLCEKILMLSNNDLSETALQSVATSELIENDQLAYVISEHTDEYQAVLTQFDEQMRYFYTQIIQIERIENKRWYLQYLAHKDEFKRRLGKDTERILYHGCDEQAANNIVAKGFSRNFAGQHGARWGYGVYFSSRAGYSDAFALPNKHGEKRMFLANILIGESALGNPSMRVPPVGFDSTTDGSHIFVIYHDAQAYATYLIVYK
ncbi:unnamed protein product [Adineta ricciae]|uniref:Poly [ADP-ribose] polymerase n=1 Tax=Adineta ricciae TaxID=249248 RepID=A0A813U1I4_ADIRI|nr:unnamed protein product [Adineta ricciae]CAF1121348.1 unnamed protein product [Adineta ricciae]